MKPTDAEPISLAALFSKSEAASVKVSPRGNYLTWMARTDGVLNLWLAPLPLPPGDMGPAAVLRCHAHQLTASRVDCCFHYRFTHDERRILYLRETVHGSELYHLYCIDVQEALNGPPVASGRDLLAAYPHLTCSIGFVGGGVV